MSDVFAPLHSPTPGPSRAFVFQVEGHVQGGFTVCRREPFEALLMLLERLGRGPDDVRLMRREDLALWLVCDITGRPLARLAHGMTAAEALLALIVLRGANAETLAWFISRPAPSPAPFTVIQGGRA